MHLTDDQRSHWEQNGWVVMASALTPGTVAALSAWVAEVAAWAETGGPGLHHHEQTDAGPAIARSERFADDHAGLGAFVRGPELGGVLAALLGEPATLFKEKINYKHPGGGGFAPHQDATAYRFVDHHISVMVPLDMASEASGCLWFAPGHRRGQLPTDERGRIAEHAVDRLSWAPVEATPGDMVFFDSYAPHRSDTNRTDHPRRALYLTYNAASRGDFRAPYYADKEAEFAREGASFDDQRVRISISDDFLGRPVSSGSTTSGTRPGSP